MIIFHGGCTECTQQDIEGIDFCVKCRYFDADWSLPSLNNREPDEADLMRRQLKEKHNIP